MNHPISEPSSSRLRTGRFVPGEPAGEDTPTPPTLRKWARKAPPTDPLAWFWSQSTLMREVVEGIELAARSEINVLIVGETGTGKELVARAIYERRRARLGVTVAEAPFVPVNCGAIPEALAESILFGHERGAFTSARERQMGKFESARKGTLFLDEIQGMSSSLQIKLLRVIQHRECERLGARAASPIECQIVAAANVPLELLVDRQAFRRDLYYRLNICPIYLPPLRRRKEDLPVLVEGLLRRVTEMHRLPMPEVTPEALAALEGYDWPGNLRELEHALLYAALRAGGVIRMEHLPGFLTGVLARYLEDGAWTA